MTAPSARAAAAGAALPLILAGCVQLRFERDLRLEPLPKQALESLAIGRTDFSTALAQLGPPVFCWELPDEGLALAWGWLRSDGWQMRVALPSTGHGESIYVDYGSAAERMRGAVLFFDRELLLTQVREGLLRDIAKDVRPRPSAEHGEEAAHKP